MTQAHLYRSATKPFNDLVDALYRAAPSACIQETEAVLLFVPHSGAMMFARILGSSCWEHMSEVDQGDDVFSIFRGTKVLDSEGDFEVCLRRFWPTASLYREVYVDADEGDLPAIEKIFYP